MSLEMTIRRNQVLVRLRPFQSLTPLCRFGVQPNLVQMRAQTLSIKELLDEPVLSGSKENLENTSGSVSKVGMSAKKVKKIKSGFKVTDSRVYSYDEIIECPEEAVQL